MSECCLPNLGCLSIPVISTQVAGQAGTPGAAGRGIVDEYYEPSNGELTLTFSEAPLTYTTGDLRGAQGDTGATGLNGIARLYSIPIDFFSATLVNQWVQQHDYTVAANTLINLGDALVINLVSMKLYELGASFNGCQRRIRWNATSCTLVPGFAEVGMVTADTTYQYNTKLEIIKSGATTALCRITSMQDLSETSIIPVSITYQVNLTGLDFTVANTIYTDLWQAGISQVYFKSITIDKITAQ